MLVTASKAGMGVPQDEGQSLRGALGTAACAVVVDGAAGAPRPHSEAGGVMATAGQIVLTVGFGTSGARHSAGE